MSDFNSIIPIILIAFFLWLAGLSVVFYRLNAHYKRIGSKVKNGDLVKLINSLLDSNDKTVSEIEMFRKDIDRIDNHLRSPIQKVGLKKYNPFSETGGDQSFSLCLLDLEDNGFIITSLHTRDRTRVYMKPVVAGESKFELSKEEEQAIKIARK